MLWIVLFSSVFAQLSAHADLSPLPATITSRCLRYLFQQVPNTQSQLNRPEAVHRSRNLLSQADS